MLLATQTLFFESSARARTMIPALNAAFFFKAEQKPFP